MGQQAFGLPSLYDPQIAADEQELMRRQRIADMLRMQSMAPMGGTEMAGRVAIRKSPLEGVAKVFQAYMANKGDQDLLAKRGELTERQAKARELMANDYSNTILGAPPPANGGRPEGVTKDALMAGGFPQPQQDRTESPEAARNRMLLAKALQAGDSETAKILIKNALEQTPEMKNLQFKGMDPKAVGQAEMDKLRTEGQRVMSPDQVLLGANGQPTYTAPSAPSSQGKMVADLLKGAGIDPASPQGQAFYLAQLAKEGSHPNPAQMTMKVDNFLPASEEAQRDFMKSTRATYDALKQAPVALDSIEKAKKLIPAAKGFMGPGGESLLEAAKFFNNRLGTSINTEGVKNAEELRTRMFFNVLDNLKKMDAQPSQQQQAIMQDAFGRLGTDPNAVPQILDAFADTIRGKVAIHNQEVAGAVQRGVKFPYDPTINLAQPKAQGAKPAKGLVQNPDGSWSYIP